jgi:hypothetical protein
MSYYWQFLSGRCYLLWLTVGNVYQVVHLSSSFGIEFAPIDGVRDLLQLGRKI